MLSITDNPGGHAMLAPDALGTDLISRGQEVIIHLACKDWNRNALESRGWKLGSEGFHNVLALSGDYPVTGHRGLAAPVFDIDSVGLLSLFADMNDGLRDERQPDASLGKTDFFLGCVVTNHKRHEREVMPQYFKLREEGRRPARASSSTRSATTRARTTSCCAGSDASELPVSVLANVYLLSRRRRARSTGERSRASSSPTSCSRSSSARRAAPDKGRAFFVDLAAKHVAVARGLGFAGVYLGGHMPAATFGEILDLAGHASRTTTGARSRARSSSRSPDEFYFFEHDPETGLSSDDVSASYLESKRRRKTDLRVPLKYRVQPPPAPRRLRAGRAALPAGRARSTRRREVRRGRSRKAAHALEQAAKVPLFGCKDCGDCSLPEIAYVCPESQCAKNQRNGPCGGTRDGLCEVYDTECIWSQAYERLKAYGEEEAMLDGPVVVKDNALAGTSAWANTFLGRDHVARQEQRTNT